MRYARVQMNTPPRSRVGQFVAVVISALLNTSSRRPTPYRVFSLAGNAPRGNPCIIRANRMSRLQLLKQAACRCGRGRGELTGSRRATRSDQGSDDCNRDSAAIQFAAFSPIAAGKRGQRITLGNDNVYQMPDCAGEVLRNAQAKRPPERPAAFEMRAGRAPIRRRPCAAGRARLNRGSLRPDDR